MVANLTIGRKKYAHVEEEMLELMQDDINEFGPLPGFTGKGLKPNR
jgi:hypothetical protein